MEKKTFQMLANLNVSEMVEKRNGLSFLSWAPAWRLFKEACPDATYEIIINQQTGLPYFESEAGVMVYTKVTACGETHMMWLPVMDNNNKAMKAQPYEIKTKNGSITIKAFDMFDVNKALMRCLTKNIAMFGLGIYIYAGEDLPEQSVIMKAEELNKLIEQVKTCESVEQINALWNSEKALNFQSDEKFRAAIVAQQVKISSNTQNQAS